MNTAARMETTGVRNKIHLSQETADLLVEANKSHWIESRKDIVVAKGKLFFSNKCHNAGFISFLR